MGRKASFLAPGPPRYLVVNADESEPGTFKDREILFSDPHRLIEGCLITAHAIGCKQVFVYIRGEYLTEFEIVRAALDEVREAGLLGGVTIVLHRGAGAYICGEESALLESLEGKRGQPRARPSFPAVAGLYQAPTLINNV
jgi:NADH-quinone oxidoreductase subunit F